MKHLILIICLLCCSPSANAFWPFTSAPDPIPEYKEKIVTLESHLSAQAILLNRWQIASGSLGIGCVSSSSSSAPHLEPQPANITMQHHDDWDQHPHHPQSSTAANPTSWAKRMKRTFTQHWQPKPLPVPVVDQ
jgi:hypothetical protein